MSEELLPRVPCGLCGTPTTMTATKRCDLCWNLEFLIEANPELSEKVLLGLYDEDGPEWPCNMDMSRAELVKRVGQMNFRLSALRAQLKRKA